MCTWSTHTLSVFHYRIGNQKNCPKMDFLRSSVDTAKQLRNISICCLQLKRITCFAQQKFPFFVSFNLINRIAHAHRNEAKNGMTQSRDQNTKVNSSESEEQRERGRVTTMCATINVNHSNKFIWFVAFVVNIFLLFFFSFRRCVVHQQILDVCTAHSFVNAFSTLFIILLSRVNVHKTLCYIRRYTQTFPFTTN